MNPAEYAAMFRVEDSLWWYLGMREVVATLVGTRLDTADRILDAGCGTGGTLAWWQRRTGRTGKSGTGIDLSPVAVAFAARRGLARLGRGSATDLPFADGSFDGVLSLDVIYHLGVADDRRALDEIARVVRPGGWACVRVPAFDGLRSAHDAAVHTRQRYRLSDLAARVSDTGLRIDRATYANALLFPAAVAARVRRRRDAASTRAHEAVSDVRPASPLVQAVGLAALRAEAAALRHLDLPFGLSAIVVATRPKSGN